MSPKSTEWSTIDIRENHVATFDGRFFTNKRHLKLYDAVHKTSITSKTPYARKFDASNEYKTFLVLIDFNLSTQR
jgi:hypothetical protein